MKNLVKHTAEETTTNTLLVGKRGCAQTTRKLRTNYCGTTADGYQCVAVCCCVCNRNCCCVAVCCSVLQCVAVCCSMCKRNHCWCISFWLKRLYKLLLNSFSWIPMCGSVLQCVQKQPILKCCWWILICCSVLQCIAVCTENLLLNYCSQMAPASRHQEWWGLSKPPFLVEQHTWNHIHTSRKSTSSLSKVPFLVE